MIWVCVFYGYNDRVELGFGVKFLFLFGFYGSQIGGIISEQNYSGYERFLLNVGLGFGGLRFFDIKVVLMQVNLCQQVVWYCSKILVFFLIVFLRYGYRVC